MPPLLNFTRISNTDLIPGDFLRRWNYKRRRDESRNAKQAADLASSGQARILVLTIDGQDIGFIATGIYKPEKEKQYHLRILFLFVSAQYRKERLEELDGLLASEYMMGQVAKVVFNTTNVIPFKSIVLQTASDKLDPLYNSLGFSEIPGLKSWMSLPLP